MIAEIIAGLVASVFGLGVVAAALTPLYRHIRDQDKISPEEYAKMLGRGSRNASPCSWDDYVRLRLMEINSRRTQAGKPGLTADEALKL